MNKADRNKHRTLVEQVQRELLGGHTKRALIIKINSENLATNGDICFPANLLAWRGLLLEDNIDQNCSTILEHYLRRKKYETKGLLEQDILKKASESLVIASETWPMQIQKCSLQKGRVCVFLNRKNIVASAIKEAVKQDVNYGRKLPVDKSICIKINEDKDSELTTSRLRLVKEVTERSLQIQGFNIVQNNGDCAYLLTTKSEGKFEDDCHRYVCGVVKNQDTNTKEISQSWATYVDKKMEELARLVETKFLPSYEKNHVENIAEAVVKFELLSVKPGRPVFIQTSADPDKAISSSKGGSFVLYNTARICAILERFEEEVHLGNYPSLLDINNADFSLLNQEEEWELVYNFILGYPEMIDNCVHCESDFEISPQILCLFLSRLSQKFSVYYRRIRVLTEGRDHLIPTMMARLYLLRGLQVVVNNSLAILNIVPVSHM